MSKINYQDLKAKHGKVYTLTVQDGDKVYEAALREPNKMESGIYLSKFKVNLVDAGDFLIKNCMLAGDDEIKGDGMIGVAAALEAGNIFAPPSTSSCKLWEPTKESHQ